MALLQHNRSFEVASKKGVVAGTSEVVGIILHE